jgi:hypothetical protein
MSSYSSSNSWSSSEISYDMNMTEEEAMEIWLQRNEEIGERVRRRDERRRLAAAEEAASAADHPCGGGEEEPPPTSDTTNQTNAAAATLADDLDVSLRSQSASDDGISSSAAPGGGVGNFQHAASVTQSDAWRRAISHNVMGEYNPNNPDPSYHDAYHAYQRFVDMHKPGVAENFVPSTPGLAALMEQRRYLMARQGHLDSSHDVQQMQTSTLSCTAGITSSSSPQDSQEKNASTNTPADCSIRQSLSCDDIIRRISEHDEMASSVDQPSTSGSAPPFPKKSSIIRRSDNTALVAAASMRKLLNKSHESSSNSSSNNNKLGGGGDGSRRFFYAFPYPTQYNNKKVTCSGCLVNLYTNPLASNFFCQTCATVTSVLDKRDGGEGGGEAMWEEKMQDVEDMEF